MGTILPFTTNLVCCTSMARSPSQLALTIVGSSLSRLASPSAQDGSILTLTTDSDFMSIHGRSRVRKRDCYPLLGIQLYLLLNIL